MFQQVATARHKKHFQWQCLPQLYKYCMYDGCSPVHKLQHPLLSLVAYNASIAMSATWCNQIRVIRKLAYNLRLAEMALYAASTISMLNSWLGEMHNWTMRHMAAGWHGPWQWHSRLALDGLELSETCLSVYKTKT